MASPSKSWTEIADSQIDADSPIDTTLLNAIRDDLVHLREWLGGSYGAAVDHDHNGSNSKPVTSVADGAITTVKLAGAAVTLAKLKTASGSYVINGPWSGDIHVSVGNDFSHVPKITGTNSAAISCSLSWSGAYPSGQYLHISGNSVDGSVTVSWQYHSN